MRKDGSDAILTVFKMFPSKRCRFRDLLRPMREVPVHQCVRLAGGQLGALWEENCRASAQSCAAAATAVLGPLENCDVPTATNGRATMVTNY